MPAYAYLILVAGWVSWVLPFFLLKRPAVKSQQVDRRARLGIVLEGVAFSLLWQSQFWLRTLTRERAFLAAGLLALAGVLSWTGARALGRQWRFDAGLIEDHELVTTGPYHLVRHPIYASMLCLLVGTGLMITPWPLLAAAILTFIIGTEIRVRVEDQLLSSHFGARFEEYRRAVPAYVPFVR